MAQILIIDDDDDFREMLGIMLKQAGYQVVEAANGNEGLVAYKREKIDLVISDIFMPEKEGMATVSELMAYNPNVKIIVISGGGSSGQKDYLEFVKDFGVQKTLEKPFSSKDLLATIKELVEGK